MTPQIAAVAAVMDEIDQCRNPVPCDLCRQRMQSILDMGAAAERERIRQLAIEHDARTLQKCDGSGGCAGQVHVIQALSKQAAAGGHWVPFAELIGETS